MKRNDGLRMEEIRQFSRINCACVRAPVRVKKRGVEREIPARVRSRQKTCSSYQRKTHMYSGSKYVCFDSKSFACF